MSQVSNPEFHVPVIPAPNYHPEVIGHPSKEQQLEAVSGLEQAISENRLSEIRAKEIASEVEAMRWQFVGWMAANQVCGSCDVATELEVFKGKDPFKRLDELFGGISGFGDGVAKYERYKDNFKVQSENHFDAWKLTPDSEAIRNHIYLVDLSFSDAIKGYLEQDSLTNYAIFYSSDKQLQLPILEDLEPSHKYCDTLHNAVMTFQELVEERLYDDLTHID
ncbi:MAG: hypothetical protein AAF740_01335 [Bacteroidota bacterium]